MRILKFVFGGLIGLLLISFVLKALFFLTFAALLAGGVFMARRAFLHLNGYGAVHHHHAMRQQMMQKNWHKGNTQYYIESIDDLVQRQAFVPNTRVHTSSAYREIDLI